MADHMPCAACGGSGMRQATESQPCFGCGGSGKAYGYGDICTTCGGSGTTMSSHLETCPHCVGSGKIFTGGGAAAPVGSGNRRGGRRTRSAQSPEANLAALLALALGGAIGWFAYESGAEGYGPLIAGGFVFLVTLLALSSPPGRALMRATLTLIRWLLLAALVVGGLALLAAILGADG